MQTDSNPWTTDEVSICDECQRHWQLPYATGAGWVCPVCIANEINTQGGMVKRCKPSHELADHAQRSCYARNATARRPVTSSLLRTLTGRIRGRLRRAG